MLNRVVITGLGPITPIGVGRDAFWEALCAGRSGIRNVEDVVDLAGIDVKIGGPVDAFDPLDYVEAKKARRLDRSTQFALAATRLALQDAAIDLSSCDLERFGVVTGTGIGGMETFTENLITLLEKGPRRVNPFFVPSMMPNAISGEISIEHGMKGPNFGVVSACASGTHAIGLAAKLIQSGDLDCAIAGGAEAVLLPITYAGFARMGAVSKRNDAPQRASRPFDKNRDGFVMGEGAGLLVLESYEHARARGARIYASLDGFGMSADASHITSPVETGEGAAQAMAMALRSAGLTSADVDYINAHGTSTPPNDRVETNAIKLALGERARQIKISSTKSQIGHLLGAAGGVEAIATVLSMTHGIIPATLNLETADPDCDLDYTPVTAKQAIRVALSNSFGFGGQNACLLFQTLQQRD
ncbi:beta-ketoacyl-ACP synthase II [Candidatus Bipolaricaulota bacterium]|nr:beta-ketoacyl-ACP synthase II [Candidatus Bipolaricaulota bacterium]